MSGMYPEIMEALLNASGGVLLFWTAWIGGSLLRLHLNIDWGRTILLLGKAYFVFFGLMMLLEMESC